MLCFPNNSVCVVGLSKVPNQNPITFVHQSLICSFVVNRMTGEIYDAQFNTICRITSLFLAEQLIGLSLLTDMDEMRERIMNRYLGDSRKAIIVILKDAASKLRERQSEMESVNNSV